MFCFKCGSEIIEVGNFCKVCGAPVVVASEPDTSQTTQSIPTVTQPYPPPVADSPPAAPAPQTPQAVAPPLSAQPEATPPETASVNAAPQYAPPQYASQNTPPPKPKKGKPATLPIIIAAVVGVVIIAVALFFIIGMLNNSDADTDTIESPPGSEDEIQNSDEDMLDEEFDEESDEDSDALDETEDSLIPEDSEDDNYDSVQWLSYEMSIEILEEEPPGTNPDPDGRYVHVIFTYISDDDDLGGFLFEEVMEKSDFIMTDASGNIYEHVGIISPVSIDFSAEEGFSADEIQPIFGVFFDIPLDIQLGELTFSVGN